MRALAIGLILLLPACATDAVQRPGSEATPPEAPVEAQPGGEKESTSAPVSGSASEGAANADSRPTSKTAAAVDIEAQLGSASGSLRIGFRAAATDVTVKVWGVDGLVVQGDATPIAGRSFARDEKVDLSVSFTAPPSGASLAVSVSGTFGTRRLSKVQSFAVGAPKAPSSGPGELRNDSSGRPVRVMKPQ
jgi:hypothetical protein